MRRWLAYISLSVTVLAYSLGCYIGVGDRWTILEYTPSQLERLAQGDHSLSDGMVRNTVKLYAYHHRKNEAFRQLRIVWNADSAYWPVLFCKAYLLEHEGKPLPSIQYYERALAANVGCLPFDAGGGNIFSDRQAFQRLSECYKLLYFLTHDEYHRHLIDEYRRASVEN